MDKYKRRGSFPENFMGGLECYKYIIEISNEKDSHLDIQYRGEYLNVYYNGGSLLKLSGSGSVYFDEKYFHTPLKDDLRSSDIEKLRKDNYLEVLKRKPSKKLKSLSEKELERYHEQALVIYQELCCKRDSIIRELKACRTRETTHLVLQKMENQMDTWKACLADNGWKKGKKDERSVQQYLSLYNKHFTDSTDFIVLDIEYALSALSKYRKDCVKDSDQPRLDILAIDREGQLYVFELKYGMKSVDLEHSGAKAHKDDFYNTVGNEQKWKYFMDDVKILFDRKKKDRLIDDVMLDETKKPVFAFVMKCENENDIYNFKKHLSENEMQDTLTLYLPVDSVSEEYPEENYKLSKSFIQECK